MSDAITLDVLSSSPVQLDVGDADPIAREEIAALATRVTTVKGDLGKLATRVTTVEGDLGKLAEDVNDRISTYWAWFQDGEDRRLGIVTDE